MLKCLILTTGNGCGYNVTTMDYPLLYFPAINVTALSANPLDAFKYSTCVKSCPRNNTDTVVCKPPTFFTSKASYFKECQYYPEAYTTNGVTYYGSAFRYDTISRNYYFYLNNLSIVFNRYCVPDPTTAMNEIVTWFKKSFYDTYLVDHLTDYISDAYKAWYVLLICFGIAFAFGFVYMFFLRCCAGVFVFLSIMTIMFGLAGAGVWLWFYRLHYDPDDKEYKFFQIAAYTLWGMSGLFTLIVLCLCNQIRLGVAIIKCTAQFVYGTPTVFLVPVWFLISILIYVSAWAISAVFLFSVGTIKPRDPPL